MKNIIEMAKEAGIATGIVSSNTLVEGSNVPFIGHSKNRMMTDEITAQYVDTGVDVFIGAGESFFTNSVKGFGPPTGAGNPGGAGQGQGRPQGQGGPGQGGPGAGGPQMTFEPRADKRDLLGELKQKGYQILHSWEEIKQVKSGKVAGFTDKRDDTLVIVAGSPEASGMTLVGGDIQNRTVEAKWTMPGMANHSGIMVPYFAYGAGAEQFGGTMLNTQLFEQMKSLLRL